jgi:hypothetical protein
VGKLRLIVGLVLLAGCTDKAPAPEARSYAPQYALWTDGATKERTIYLPPGSQIDASDPNAWDFPIGTKLTKQFSFGARKVETRTIERTAGGWEFRAFVWSADGKTMSPAPARGMTTEVDGVRHRIPGQSDCKVCHGNGKTPVLGFSALQLSGDRDPKAPHTGIDLPALVAEGRLKNFTGTTSPRIAARTATERAALGYLHANCGHCHRNEGPLASLELSLTNGEVTASTIDRPSRIAPSRMRIARHSPSDSVLVDRMKTRDPTMQMPPLGTELVDERGVALVSRWVGEL